MKIATILFLFFSVFLSACTSRQTVGVVNMPERSQAISQNVGYYRDSSEKAIQDLKNRVGNDHIMAICRDGSYVIEINEHSCLGHGGIVISREKYRAD